MNKSREERNARVVASMGGAPTNPAMSFLGDYQKKTTRTIPVITLERVT